MKNNNKDFFKIFLYFLISLGIVILVGFIFKLIFN